MKTPSYDKNRSCLGEVLPIKVPFRLTIDTSEVCNFKCNYCFRAENTKKNWGYAADNGIMTMDTFDIVLEQIKGFPESPRVIALSGMGEPLCNKNITAMVRKIREARFASKIELHTNASLLTEAMAKDLAVCGIDKIVISLQGLTEKKYKEICAFDLNFKEFCKNLKVLYENKLETMEINIKIVDIALQGKEDEKKFYDIFSQISDKNFVENIIALWQEQIDYSDEINNQINKFGINFGHIECCPIAFTNITIAPNGDVYPCCVINPPFALGNVEQNSLVEMFNGQLRTDFLIAILQKGRECHSRCATCYFPKGYVKTELDLIDYHREEILERIKK